MLRLLSSRCAAVTYSRRLHNRFAAVTSTAEATGKTVNAVSKNKKPVQQQQQQQPVLGTTWNTVVVGEIVAFHPHPQADRLNVCSVNIGDMDNLLQIICGATNVCQGARVPVAKVGTRLVMKEPETGELRKLKIKKSKLRGEISQGMICSEAELGLADKSEGILIFEADAVVGSLVREHVAVASRLEGAHTLPVHVAATTDVPLETRPSRERDGMA
uniref:tRNA-binding domain-containing protein n=1 Tax=Peronospora matthiolae TaxID=2874970 RepID=A0AAV1VD26_9STRA